MTTLHDAGVELLTVDELAAATGMTVRTTRYYAGLGLLPAPERRGRMAYYGPEHRARLELIRSLQDHGFTLAAIEKYLDRLPIDASPEDLAVQRAMLTSWTPGKQEALTKRQLEERVGRRLSAADIDVLVKVQAMRERDGRYEPLAPLHSAVEMLDLDIPVESYVEAADAIGRHMDELADELTRILRDKIVTPFRESEHSEEDAARFQQTFSRLRQLTLEAVVAGFQRAANQVITRSLG
jgi:DNA-binding transcriptional MerR regulator